MGLKDKMNQNAGGVNETKQQSTTPSVLGGEKKYSGDVAKLTQIKDDAIKDLAQTLATGRDTGDKTTDELINDAIDNVLNGEIIQKRDRMKLVEEIRDEVYGLGPLSTLISDTSISEIMVNGPKQVYVEKNGKLTLSDVHFDDNAHVRKIIDRIVTPLGRHIDDSNPMVDARLKDGSRVNAIIPPCALKGPTITIRKFSAIPFQMSDLLRFGSLSPQMAEFLQAAVVGRLNVLISGGTGSGKTTLLNVMSSFIPASERIVTIEDAAELRLLQDHVVPLEARPANIEGEGAITIRDLVKNALRMRPDRIVVGEVRGGEALDMLQAMNTGHDGSLTTAHANSPRDAIARIETMALMSGMELPAIAIRQQCASAFDLIVQQSRMKDGSRKITSVCEVMSMMGDTVTTQEIYHYKVTDIGDNGAQIGHFEATGVKPACCEKIEGNGVRINNAWFQI